MSGKITPRFCDMVASQKFITGEWSLEIEKGIITRTKDGYKIKGKKDKGGYLRICTDFDGERVAILYHRAVWIGAHRGKLPEAGLVIDHVNGNKKDNRFENLELVTQKENCNNPNAPSQKRGEKNTQSIFTNAEVKEIRRKWDSTRDLPKGERPTITEFSKKYHTTRLTISRIVYRKTYTDNPAEQEPNYTASQEATA